MTSPLPSLLTLPPSLLRMVASYLDGKDLGAFALVHSSVRDAGEAIIWESFYWPWDQCVQLTNARLYLGT